MLLKTGFKIEQHRRTEVLVWFGLALILGWVSQSCLGQSQGAGAEHYRVLTLRHISPEQGRQYLADANAGTAGISHLPGTNSLLVTASAENLIKIAAILKLVDTNEPYVVKPIGPGLPAGEMPSVETIAERVGKISIGTFFNPPGTTSSTDKAIIDVFNNNFLVIAPAGRMEKILSAIEQGRQAKGGKPEKLEALAEPNQARAAADIVEETAERKRAGVEPNTPQPDELFNGLLNSLTEAEKRAAETAAATKQEQEVPQAKQEEQEEPTPTVLDAERGEQGEKSKVKTESESSAQEGVIAQATTKDIETAKVTRLYEPEPLGDSNEMLELDLPETLKLIDLLDLVGKYLHLDYLYDAGTLQTQVVNLKVQGPIKVKDLYPLLESVLRFRGFVMTRKGNLVTVALSANIMDYDPTLVDPATGKVQYGDLVITRVFQLKYVDTGSATNLLNNMKLGATIIPIPETGTLIVTGYAFRMERAEKLLEMIDKPGRPKQFKFRQLKYTMAKTLAPKVKTLIEQLGTISITVGVTEGPSAAPGRPIPARTRPVPQPMPQPQPGGAPGGESAKPTVYLDADERTNRVLMIGQEAELSVVDELISALDVEQADLRTMRVYEIQNVDAGEVRNKLTELGIVAGGTGAGYGRGGEGRISRTIYERAPGVQPGMPAPTPMPAAAVAAGAGTAGGELLAEEPQVVVVESINALLVNGTAEQHLRIATIIGYLDQATLQQAINYVIYPLENQKPTDLAEVLNKLIQETIKDEKGKVEKIVQRQEDNIIIVPDENTFSLIVYASRKNQEWIANLIKTLDKRRPQVLIDVTLVEVSKSDSFDYDLKLLSSFPDLTDTSGLTQGLMGDANSTSTSLVSRLTGSSRTQFADFQTNKTTGGLGFYADRHINALLTAIQTKSYGRVLAKPKILVNDNEAGKIDAKDMTYVRKESSTQVQTGGVNNNLVTSVDYQGYDAGITLAITPHISEGELLRLEIDLTRSDFGTITGLKPPDTTSSNLSTVVTVPDGSTIILGGLVKLNQGKGGSKVPLLGDIPLIGAAFRSVSNKDIQKKLYVFVKAEILRPEGATYAKGDLVKISDKNREAFERQEREFQDYNDVPGTKPQPMDPVRVLDAE